MSKPFLGQWKGESESGSFVLANIAQDDEHIFGRVSVLEGTNIDGEAIDFWSWSYFEATPLNEHELEGKVNSPSIHHRYGELFSDDEINNLTKNGIYFPTETNFKGWKDGEHGLQIEWTSKYPDGSTRNDKATLEKERIGGSKVKHEEMSWHRFKEYALEQNDGLIYRGQARHWRLRTSFHRTGHADLITYLDEKVPELEYHINSFSKHFYNTNDDRSLGALLNLAQHHGYPTPLLDWTKSPYVAAFFAFEDKGSLKKDGRISIFEFNERMWSKMTGKYAPMRVPNLVIRTLELPGFGNSRALPQQSITMFSNVDNIEGVIQHNEKTTGDFVKAISIPTSDRDAAMRDLSLMGITWGSMFPGYDGICKQLRSRHF